MLYRHAAELAIRAALYLAQQPSGKRSPVREIASATDLSAPYLAKIMNRLNRAGLVRAYRGPGGGLALAQDPARITVWAVVRAIEGSGGNERCVLGLGLCSEDRPCPFHQQWIPLRDGMQRLLEQTTLATLADGLRRMAAPATQDESAGEAEPAGTAAAAPGQRKNL